MRQGKAKEMKETKLCPHEQARKILFLYLLTFPHFLSFLSSEPESNDH